VLLIGGAIAIFAIGHGKKKNTAGGTDASASASASASPSPSPSRKPSPTKAASATPEPGNAAQYAKKGQCLKITGPSGDPKTDFATCGTGTFEVLQRFDATLDESKCDSVTGTTHTYHSDNPNFDILDFVLCLKPR